VFVKEDAAMKHAAAIAVLLVLALAATGRPQEMVQLTTPVEIFLGASQFRVWQLTMRRAHPDTPAAIRAIYRETDGTTFVADGKRIVCDYEGAEAETLIVALNKVNLSTTSLEKRLIQRCQADGKLGAGTIVGVPQ
jgi:hypothetical protein